MAEGMQVAIAGELEEVSLQDKVTDQLVPENLKEPAGAMAAPMREVQYSHTQKTA